MLEESRALVNQYTDDAEGDDNAGSGGEEEAELDCFFGEAVRERAALDWALGG